MMMPDRLFDALSGKTEPCPAPVLPAPRKPRPPPPRAPQHIPMPELPPDDDEHAARWRAKRELGNRIEDGINARKRKADRAYGTAKVRALAHEHIRADSEREHGKLSGPSRHKLASDEALERYHETIARDAAVSEEAVEQIKADLLAAHDSAVDSCRFLIEHMKELKITEKEPTRYKQMLQRMSHSKMPNNTFLKTIAAMFKFEINLADSLGNDYDVLRRKVERLTLILQAREKICRCGMFSPTSGGCATSSQAPVTALVPTALRSRILPPDAKFDRRRNDSAMHAPTNDEPNADSGALVATHADGAVVPANNNSNDGRALAAGMTTTVVSSGGTTHERPLAQRFVAAVAGCNKTRVLCEVKARAASQFMADDLELGYMRTSLARDGFAVLERQGGELARKTRAQMTASRATGSGDFRATVNARLSIASIAEAVQKQQATAAQLEAQNVPLLTQ